MNHALGILLFSTSVAHAQSFPPPETVRQALSQMPELRSTELPQLPNLTHLKTGDVFMVYAHADDELPTIAAVAGLRAKYPERRFHWILVSDNGLGLA